MTEKSRIALAEGIGTLYSSLPGREPRSSPLAASIRRDRSGVLGVALAFGLGLLCAAYTIGSISGCHINPAVTVGLWAVGKTKAGDIPYYIGGQVVGRLLGAVIIFVIAAQPAGFSAKATGFASNGYGAHSPGGFKLAHRDPRPRSCSPRCSSS